jgi:hypothetical protein
VLGANDGIVSTAGLVVGVAAATTSSSVIFTAGLAGLVAGGVSMALGEYVSVSTQRDTQRALLQKERQELDEMPEAELEELAGLYAAKGLSAETARVVARELTERDAFAAHIDVELGIDPDDLSNPWQAALSSAVAFTLGGRSTRRDSATARRRPSPRGLPVGVDRSRVDRDCECHPGRCPQEARGLAGSTWRSARDARDLRHRPDRRNDDLIKRVVTVDVQAEGANLRLSISDDGIGGADPHQGSGLIG